jgi:hypothetical protein
VQTKPDSKSVSRKEINMKSGDLKGRSRKWRSKDGQPCIVCGSIGRETKFPAGSIYLCSNQDCKDVLLTKINDNTLPIAQFNLQALVDHEIISEEIVNHFANDFKTIKQLAIDVEEFIWDGETLGVIFDEALTEAGETLERKFIAGLKDKELPLHTIDEFKSKGAKKFFEDRLKGSPG